MPPTTKVSKEDIVSAALRMMQKNGENTVNARSLASYIGCSTQPIFSGHANNIATITVKITAKEIITNFILDLIPNLSGKISHRPEKSSKKNQSYISARSLRHLYSGKIRLKQFRNRCKMCLPPWADQQTPICLCTN